MEDMLERIKELLAENPKGLTITAVSQNIGINRNAVAKYLNILQAAGEVDMKPFGRSLIYSLSGRLPMTKALSLSSELIVLIDSNLQIVEANEQFLGFNGHRRDQVVGRSLDGIDSSILTHPNVLFNIKKSLNGKEYVNEISVTNCGNEHYFKIKMIPVAISGAHRGVALIAENITARKKAEIALRESEARYRAMVETNTDFIIRFLPDMTVTFTNQNSYQLSEKEFIDLRRRKLTDYLSSEDVLQLSRDLGAITVEKPSLTDVREVRFRSGLRMWMNVTITGIFDNHRRLSEFQIVARDVTSLKIAERVLENTNAELEKRVKARTAELGENEEKFRVLAETTNVGVSLYRNDRWIYVNPSMEKSLGYTSAELLSMPAWNIVRPDYRELIKSRAMDRQHGLSVPSVYEFPALTKSDETRWVEVSAGLIMYQGEPTCIATFFDITERKLANDALRVSEEMFRGIFDESPAGMAIVSLDYRYLRVNDQMIRLTGYSEAELLGMTYLQITHPDDRALTLENAGKIYSGEVDHLYYEKRYVRKDGEVRWSHVSLGLQRDSMGRPLYFIGTAEDISDRKLAEESQRLSEERLQLCTTTAHIGIYDWDVENDRHFWSPETHQIYGIPQSTPITLDMLKSLIYPGDEKSSTISAAMAPEGPGRYSIEYRIIRPSDGEVRWVQLNARILFAGVGKDRRATRVLGAVQDLTERKESEEALRVSVEKFRVLSETSSAMILMHQGDCFQYANRASEQITGYSKEELLKMQFWEFVHPEFREMVKRMWLTRQRGEPVPSNYEFKLLTKDGGERWVDVSAGLIDYAGKPTVIATLFDITERKQAEDALRKSETRYRMLIDSLPLGIFTSDLEGNTTSINPKLLEILGSKSPEFTRSVNNLNFDPAIKSGVADALRDCIRTGEDRVIEGIITSYWGKSFYMRLHLTPLRDDAGQVYSILGVIEDVTERKMTEVALRESEEKFRVLAETTNAGIALFHGAKCIYVNPEVEKISGYDNTELLSMVVWDNVHSDYRELVKQWVTDRQRGLSVPANNEFPIITKDGQTRWVEASVGLTTYQEKPTQIATFFDITERKNAVNAVYRSLSEKDILLKEVHHRVKNNLQIISSLLNLQSESITDPNQLALFRECQDRVRSMALIHERLYKSDDLSLIEFTGYANKLAKDLISSYNQSGGKVRCRIEGTPVYLTIEEAVPCGLILNELVSNSLKYAFPGDQMGEIVISICQDQNQFLLAVSDDGAGLPQGFRLGESASLGLELVSTLTDQLGGALEIGSGPGASFSIAFNRPPDNNIGVSTEAGRKSPSLPARP